MAFKAKFPEYSGVQSGDLTFKMEVDPNLTSEQLRLYRTGMLRRIIVRALSSDDTSFQQNLLGGLSDGVGKFLNYERGLQTDTDRGSFHHVFHQITTGHDDKYLAPIWYNNRSYHAYLPFVEGGMKLLEAWLSNSLHWHKKRS